MPTTQNSTGVFPGNSAIRSVTQDEFRRLTYGTAYKCGVPGKVMREDDKWENFMNIHAIGRRDTKYMKFQQQKAPLLDRSACGHRRDYVELPLGDNIVNSALAKSFKTGLKGGAAGNSCSAKAESAYKSAFSGYTEERTRSAKMQSFKPKQSRTMTITGMTDMLETMPSSHVTHSAPELSLAKAAEIMLARPNLSLPGRWEGAPPKTSYKREFCLPARTRSVPNMAKCTPEEADSELLPEDHPSFNMRRMCYMSPGQ